MKPEYKFFKNFRYAREGFLEVLKKETSFKLQVAFFVFLTLIAVFLPVAIWMKLILIASLFIPLVVELINSAVERVVDLVTQEYDLLAKHAKDAAAAAVMISFAVPLFVWLSVIVYFCK